MNLPWHDWLSLLIRWLHVVTAIAWIGTSFYFIWLDKSLRRRSELPPGTVGESWFVHGGGFYQLQKFAVAPAELPPQLHWFKYEAYFTWLSGFALLAVMYYWGAEHFLIDPQRIAFSRLPAIATSVAFLAGGWLAYDLLCRSPIGRHTTLLAVSVFALLVVSAWALNQLFSDRAAFMHIGAMIATMMSANVFFVIIPNQKKVVNALKAGATPALQLGQQAGQRSLHNNYLTLPVVLLMMSAHYPMLFAAGADLSWLVVALILVIGGVIRDFFNIHHEGGRGLRLLWQWPLAGALIVALAWLLASYSAPAQNYQLVVSDGDALAIVRAHCSGCHANVPSVAHFSTAPAGVILESLADLRRQRTQVLAQAVSTRVMPLGNPTAMTLEDRARLGTWIRQQSN
jgi:uncharacterized membrane protein